jgi:hypothetical protein
VAKTVIEGQEHLIARTGAGKIVCFWLIQLDTKNINISKLCI